MEEAAGPVLVIHGGAGTISRATITPEKAAAFRAALRGVLATCGAALAAGAPAVDVVCDAVAQMEDCPLFNAGQGAVFTAAGTHELDAAVMAGEGERCGAVACAARTRNPVRAARAVMERGAHVLLVGAGADAFAEAAGCEMVGNDFFSTAWRAEQLAEARAAGAAATLDHGGAAARMGTVGAVALDAAGRLAAATSTGGMTNKAAGRVGDTPLCGAGTFCSRGVAVSCTGTGEAFIRLCAAKDLAARMEYGGLAVGEAAQAVVGALGRVGGSGGLIAVDAGGAVATPFNTEGMYRGVFRARGAALSVAIWGEEEG
jgi:beta-aspartyl-peptidase (threonine type)